MDELWLYAWAVTMIWLEWRASTVMRVLNKLGTTTKDCKPEIVDVARRQVPINAPVEPPSNPEAKSVDPVFNLNAIKKPPRPQGGFGSKV